MIARHRLVNAALAEELEGPVHALSISAQVRVSSVEDIEDGVVVLFKSLFTCLSALIAFSLPCAAAFVNHFLALFNALSTPWPFA